MGHRTSDVADANETNWHYDFLSPWAPQGLFNR